MLERFRGDTQTMTWELTVNDVAVDLTDATIQFAYNKNSEIVKLEGAIIGPAADGKVKFTPTATTFDTELNTKFDIQVTFQDGTIRTFIKDDLDIIDDVNK